MKKGNHSASQPGRNPGKSGTTGWRWKKRTGGQKKSSERGGRPDGFQRRLFLLGLGKVRNEILKQRKVADGEPVEFDAAFTHRQLVPGAVGQFYVVDHRALDAVHVDKPAVAAENLPDAKASQTDIHDLAEIHQFVGTEKSRKSTFLTSEPAMFPAVS